MDNKLLDKLDIMPVEKTEVPVVNYNGNDIELAKNNIKDLVELGKRSFEELMEIAKASQHPRAYEVLSTFMNSLISANKEIVSIAEKNGEEGNSSTNIQNNIFFSGSTAELQKALMNMKKNNE